MRGGRARWNHDRVPSLLTRSPTASQHWSKQATAVAPLFATTLFTRLWGVAHVVHLCVASASRLSSPSAIVVVVLGLLVVLRPHGRVLALLAAAQLVDLVGGDAVQPRPLDPRGGCRPRPAGHHGGPAVHQPDDRAFRVARSAGRPPGGLLRGGPVEVQHHVPRPGHELCDGDRADRELRTRQQPRGRRGSPSPRRSSSRAPSPFCWPSPELGGTAYDWP